MCRGAARLGLSLLSAVAGALLVLLLFSLFRRITGDAALAWWAMAVAVCSPLFWFTALRPLSDVTGLAIVVGAQVMLMAALREAQGRPVSVPDDLEPAGRLPFRPAHLLVGGALLTGLAAGVRAQTVMLTAPLLVAVLVWPRTGLLDARPRRGDRRRGRGCARLGPAADLSPVAASEPTSRRSAPRPVRTSSAS